MTPIDPVEVRFDKYCYRCEHQAKDENDHPCRWCLGQPWNEGSEKPIEYKEKKNANDD